jgi:hypothetical protein
LWWSGGASLLLRALVKQKVKRHFTVFTYATAAVFTYATAAADGVCLLSLCHALKM